MKAKRREGRKEWRKWVSKNRGERSERESERRTLGAKKLEARRKEEEMEEEEEEASTLMKVCK